MKRWSEIQRLNSLADTRSAATWLTCLLSCISINPLYAQQPAAAATQRLTAPNGQIAPQGLAALQSPAALQGTVKLNLRGETPISTLIEYVSQRLTIRFIYDESLAQKKIFLQAPDEIPVASLMELLQSALRINDLVIVETDAKGWYRITSATNIPRVAIPATSEEKIAAMGAAVPVTQIFLLKRADPTQIKELIAPFLTASGANSIPVPANRTPDVLASETSGGMACWTYGF